MFVGLKGLADAHVERMILIKLSIFREERGRREILVILSIFFETLFYIKI